MTRVMVIGGTGFFGQRLCRLLALEPGLDIVVASRSLARARELAATLRAPARAVAMDLNRDFAAIMAQADPQIVIHTAGPFQGQGYGVAETCIAQGRHYLDLADGRDFVRGIGALDAAARARGVAIIAGASTLPALSAAIVDEFAPRFTRLTGIDIALATAQLARAGAATIAAAMSYCGRPIATRIAGRERYVRGWRGLQRRDFAGIGKRWVAHCDVPDLALFQERYPTAETIHFRAGTEIAVLQFGLWLQAGWSPLVNLLTFEWPWPPRNWHRSTQSLSWQHAMAHIAKWFDRFGSDRSGFHVILDGLDADGVARRLRYSIIASRGEGTFIPTVPAAIIARQLAAGEFAFRGAAPCLGFMTLEQFRAAVSHLAIETRVETWDTVKRHWVEGS